MKYVIDQYNNVVLGSGPVSHRDLFRSLVDSGSNIKAAGHCRIENGRVHVLGESVGYGIAANADDATKIEQALGI